MTQAKGGLWWAPVCFLEIRLKKIYKKRRTHQQHHIIEKNEENRQETTDLFSRLYENEATTHRRIGF
jgi:hypothetical protein